MNLVKMIDNRLVRMREERDKEREDRERSGHYPSSASIRTTTGDIIGSCILAEYRKWKRVPETNPYDADTLQKFTWGDMFHDWITEMLQHECLDGNCITSLTTESANSYVMPVEGLRYPVRGRMDNVINKNIGLEIKSSFGKYFYSKEGLMNKGPRDSNLMQTLCYLKAHPELEYAILLFVARDIGYKVQFNIYRDGDSIRSYNYKQGERKYPEISWQGMIDRWGELERYLESGNEPPADFKYRSKFPCLAKGTLVEDASGHWIPIEKIKEGSMIRTVGGRTKVLKKMCSGVKKTYEIKPFGRLSINATIDHRFLVAQFSSRAKFYSGSFIPLWMTVGDIMNQENVQLLTPIDAEIKVTPNLNKNKMRLLGYYCADGSLHCREAIQGYPREVRFTINEKDDIIAEDIKLIIKKEWSKRGTRTTSGGTTINVRDEVLTDKRTGWKYRVVSIGSVEVCNFIRSYFTNYRKAVSKSLSNGVMKANVELQQEFLTAAIRGDGSIGQNRDSSKFVTLGTSSRVLANQYQTLFFRAGKLACLGYGVREEKKQLFGNKEYDVQPGYRVTYYESGHHYSRIVKIGDIDYVLSPIQYIKESQEKETWDISVSSDLQAFITEVGLTHNCNYCLFYDKCYEKYAKNTTLPQFDSGQNEA